MSRTTPPRPVDIAALFPELREHSGTSTRLHPRPGAPTAADSSVGGPLLWPAGEAWPVCAEGDAHYTFELRTPANVRRSREIFAGAAGRSLTDAERAELAVLDDDEPDGVPAQMPMVPVAQLYRRDIPDFAGPDDMDLLQILWCPLDHEEEGYNPKVSLVWRRSAEVTDPLAAMPEPPVVSEDYLPNPCVVHPEQVREFQYGGLLPRGLGERILAWEEGQDLSYQFDLSLAPGWKVGGFANWSLTDPLPVDCAECGTPMTLLFTADSSEWQGGDDSSWRPLEEPEDASPCPVDVTIGRGYSLYVFRCPVSEKHPPATAMQ